MKILSGLVALAFMFPTIANAGSTSEFEALDKNGDGVLSVFEVAERLDLVKSWMLVDENTNGQLELSEFLQFGKAAAYIQEESEDEANIGAAPH